MAQNQGLPNPGYPFVDNMGKVSPVWYQFLSSLWQRTGSGSNTGNVQSVSVSAGSGIVASVSNSTSTPNINLTLGAISPTSIICSGPISGTIGSFSGGLSTTGPMQFGSHTAAVLTNSGYIPIIDINGNTRFLIVGT